MNIGGIKINLSKIQTEIYRLLCDVGLSVKCIATRRQTSFQSVYKTINILKKKGHLSNGFKPYEKERGTIQPFLVNSTKKYPKIRLHGEQFRIKIITQSKKYDLLKSKSNQMIIKGSKIILHKNSISIFNKNSYFGDSVTDCLKSASTYLDNLLWRLEDKLGIIICKTDYTNCKCVKSHYAETKNGLAKDYEKKDLRLKLKSNEDGKVWLIIDNSYNLHELETTHPKNSNDDMQIIRPFFNDLREHNNIMLPSQMHENILTNHKSLKSTNQILDKNSKLTKDIGLVLKDLIEGKIKIKDPIQEDEEYKDDKTKAYYFG